MANGAKMIEFDITEAEACLKSKDAFLQVFLGPKLMGVRERSPTKR